MALAAVGDFQRVFHGDQCLEAVLVVELFVEDWRGPGQQW